MRESIPCAKKDLGGFVDYLLPSKLSLPLVFITMQVRFGPTVCIRYNLLIQKVFCLLASFRKLQKGYFPRKMCVLIGPLFSVKESPLIYYSLIWLHCTCNAMRSLKGLRLSWQGTKKREHVGIGAGRPCSVTVDPRGGPTTHGSGAGT